MRHIARISRSVVQYFQGAYKEFRQVSWPTRTAILNYTIIVTVTIAISVLILTAFDFGLQQITDRYLIR